MVIIDAHLDLAMNALQYERDLLQSVYTLRQEVPPSPLAALPTVALPELRRGRIALCFATTIARATGRPERLIDFASPTQAYAVAQGQLAYYRALAQGGHVRLIGDTPALDEHFAAWREWDAQPVAQTSSAPPLGIVLSMESADPILAPDTLHEWWQAGVRLIGPAHYGPGRYAGGTGSEQGLSDLGRALLKEMEQLGIILDTTHLSDRAFWQALDQYGGHVIASHSNPRALVPKQRQFDDAQLRALIARDGVIGIALDAIMLEPHWIIGYSSNARVTLATVVDHIEYVCQLAGNSRHVAIGSDLDGGFGRVQSPSDLDTIADLQRLPDLLAQRGYNADDVAAMMHNNWLRVLREAWHTI